MTNKYDQEFWNNHYGNAGDIWSGKPNAQLVAEASQLTPGSALDVGAGEGADAIWLAENGWKVTGVDISPIALERATKHAAARKVEGSINFEHRDLMTWTPPARAFDLVSAQFMHLPTEDRVPLFARLAEAVAVGGSLLLVGHAPSDMTDTEHSHHPAEMFFTASEVAATLPEGEWRIEVTDHRPRISHHEHRAGETIHDEVLRATRIA